MNAKAQVFSALLPSANSFSFGVYRALTFAWLFFYFLFENKLLHSYPTFPAMENPVGMYRFLSQNIFAADTLMPVYYVFLGTLLFSCLGLFTRTAMILACVLGYWLIGHTMMGGIFSHQQFPHFLVLLIFACSEGGKNFSVDAKIFGAKKQLPHWEYQVPLFLLRSLIVLIFFSSGIAKITNGGLLWFFENNAYRMFARANFWFFDFGARQIFSSVNVLLTKIAWLGTASCFLVFIVEMLSPLILFKKFQWPLLVFLALFQIIATFALYVDFESFILLYLFWLPLKADA